MPKFSSRGLNDQKGPSLTGLNEGRAKGDNFVVLPANIGNGIDKRDAALHKIRVSNTFDGGAAEKHT